MITFLILVVRLPFVQFYLGDGLDLIKFDLV